jgi:hypothetical protein
MNEDLISFYYEDHPNESLQVVFYNLDDEQAIEIPKKLLDIIDEAQPILLPENRHIGHMYRGLRTIFILRALLFLHKKLGLVEDPLTTLTGYRIKYGDEGAIFLDPTKTLNPLLGEIIEAQYAVDSTFYEIIREGGEDLRKELKKKGYKIEDNVSDFDIFSLAFDALLKAHYNALIGGSPLHNKDSIRKANQAWRAKMTSDTKKIPMTSNLTEAERKRLQAKNERLEEKANKFEEEQVKGWGILGAIQLYAKAHSLSTLKHYLKATREQIDVEMKNPIIIQKNGVAYKVLASNKHEPIDCCELLQEASTKSQTDPQQKTLGYAM